MQNSIRSRADLDWVGTHCDHVLTLFSGGLDSSYVLHALAGQRCKVTALTIDLGDGVNVPDLQQIASHFGAELRVIDGCQRFAEEAVLPAVRAQARYMGMYPISSSLSRPVIAQYAVQLAHELGCDAIVHTANQSQNSLRRLNGALAQLGYTGHYGTPYEYTAISREEKIEALRAEGLTRFQARGISGDANLWCREFESGSLDNPEAFWVPETLFEWTRPRSQLPDTEITLHFAAGRPIAVDDFALPLTELIAALNERVGSFGVGRYSGLEHLAGGEKVLEVREAPAATLLMDAYRHLETATIDAETLREKQAMEQLWVREALEGRWFGGLRAACEAFIQATTRTVSGTVGYRLRAGAADVCSIRANSPRYLTDRDGWEKQAARHSASRGLAELMQSHREAA
ncbi:argininosuccinate synthase-related protein [Chitinolyticbacter meiyuanensis]|uniref:argininosuccinate synthase-related protein n=1 Tax=Chitinolyticbacter meiyuanensis TaxID=682798 RepID=UPI0011E59CA0|nr:argininosuccinate synthase-related protein [Chitinolyticbacter meiyuanensis]